MGTKKKLAAPTLDLHGKTVDQVFDLVDQFITKHKNKDRVKIMPGKGTGTIKSEVVKYLRQAGYAWHYETLPNGKKNEGIIIVPMD